MTHRRTKVQPHMKNRSRFQHAYGLELAEAFRRNANAFAWPEYQVPDVAAKMTESLANGTGLMSATVRKVAKALGVHATQNALREFLNQ